MKEKIEILLVEDNPGDYRLVKELLQEAGKIQFSLFNTKTLAETLAYLEKGGADVVLLDLGLSDSQELATFHAVNEKAYNLPIIILTGLSDEEVAIHAMRDGAQDYLLKQNLTGELLSRSIFYSIERKQAEKSLKELAAIVESSDEAIFSKTLDGTITSWNDAAEKIYGYTAKEIIGRNVSLLCPPSEQDDTLKILRKMKEGEQIVEYETVRRRKDGKIINVSLSVSPIKEKSGKVVGASVIAHDITERKFAEQQLAIQYRITLTLAESTTIDNAAHGILKTICEILNWEVGEIWAVEPSTESIRLVSNWFVKSIYKPLEEANQQLFLHKNEGLAGYIWQTSEPLWIENLAEDMKEFNQPIMMKLGLQSCFGFPVTYQGSVLGVILFFSEYIRHLDVDFLSMFKAIGGQIGTFIKRKRMEGDLLYLAQHDILTGLANRVAAENNLNAAINYAKQFHHHIAVLYLDLDYFKNINDTMGHSKGDFLLTQVAIRLRQNVRETDTVARFGGDEFIFILPKCNTENAMIAAKNIMDSFAKPFFIDEKEFYISCSIGISIYPEDGEDAQTLLKNADLAMYHAKVQGRANYQFCSPSMAYFTQQKTLLLNELHHALEKKEFRVYYQAKVDIKTGMVTGVEALIRWYRQNGSILSPVEFIPAAEETPLIVSIGDFVLESAFAQAKHWLDQGCKISNIAVNISARQLDLTFVQLIKANLQKFTLSPEMFEFEITENILMQETINNISTLNALKDLKIHIAIDDFGTGYSSFAYLKKFIVNTIKIDRSFIIDITDNSQAKAIVNSIIVMAHALSIKVVAEGVETPEQLAVLKELNCDEYQGFLFSKPLPPDELGQLIIENHKKFK